MGIDLQAMKAARFRLSILSRQNCPIPPLVEVI
jgi:hypothetical protein